MRLLVREWVDGKLSVSKSVPDLRLVEELADQMVSESEIM